MADSGLASQKIAYYFIFSTTIFGLLWGIFNIYLVSRVNMKDGRFLKKEQEEEEQEALLPPNPAEGQELLEKMIKISDLIAEVTFCRI